MQQLSKIVTRQDANFKLSPSASNETSINLSKEISALISDESGDATFTLYKNDFIKALSALCLIPKIFFKKEQQPSSLWSVFHGLSQQIEAQFGDADTSEYTIYHFKRDDGRAYFNNLKSANGFNLRAFLVEQFAVLTFERSDDGKLYIRLNIDAPKEEATPHVNIVEEEHIIDEPLQIIYYGAPGTGKSYAIDNATAQYGSVRTTFHPDSDYASFVGAYKPTMEDVPINSLKGYFGHTMGAAGILESILTMAALDDHTLLATKGYKHCGVSHPVHISAENSTTHKKDFIKILSGFGGCNAAILFRKLISKAGYSNRTFLNKSSMNENNIYIVMRFYISASDNNSNGYSNCEIFSNKKKARQLFRKWRNEELEARRETGCAFDVNTDTEQMFHCL